MSGDLSFWAYLYLASTAIEIMLALLIGASDTEVPGRVAITHESVHRPALATGEQAWTILSNT